MACQTSGDLATPYNAHGNIAGGVIQTRYSAGSGSRLRVPLGWRLGSRPQPRLRNQIPRYAFGISPGGSDAAKTARLNSKRSMLLDNRSRAPGIVLPRRNPSGPNGPAV